MDMSQIMKMAELASKAQEQCNDGSSSSSNLPPIQAPSNPEDAKKAAHQMAIRMGCDPKIADDLLTKFESMSHGDLMNTFSTEIGAKPDVQEQMKNMDPTKIFSDMQNFMANNSLSATPTPQNAAAAASTSSSSTSSAPDHSASLQEEVQKQAMDAFKRVAQIRQAGNNFFKKGNLKSAAQKYEEGLRAIRLCPNYEDSEHLTAMELNLALCRLKSGESRDCIALCTGVLARDPDNVKALFRRAKAHTELNRLPAAEEDLARAAELSPDDEAIRLELCSLHERMDDEEVLVCSSSDGSVCSSPPPCSERSTDTKSHPIFSPSSSVSTDTSAQLFRPAASSSSSSSDTESRPPARPLAGTDFLPTIAPQRVVKSTTQYHQAQQHQAKASSAASQHRRDNLPDENATPALDEIRDGFWTWVEGVKSLVQAPSSLAFSSAKQSRQQHLQARNKDLGRRGQCCMFLGVPALERPMPVVPKQPEPSPKKSARRRTSSRRGGTSADAPMFAP